MNSRSLGIWPCDASRSICSSETWVTAAGASTIRSRRRDAENTVIVSAKLSSQSTLVSTVAVAPSTTSTPVTESAFSPSVKVTV